MTHKLQFKRHRAIVEQFGIPLSFARKISPKQKLLLQKCSQLGRKKKKLSYFGQKLQAKRLFSFLYGNLSKKQYLILLKQASHFPGLLSSNFISLLEKRLDIVVYRMFHFRSLPSVRQFIRHHGVFVNNSLVTLSYFQLKPGDIIRLANVELAMSSILSETYSNFNSKGSNLLIKPNLSQAVNLKQPKDVSFPSFKRFRLKFPHLEVNYKIFTGVFLFSPKQVFYSIKIRKDDFIPNDF